MITELAIENFKCFRHLKLDIAKLTLFTGYNSGGKSSAIQPLLLLSQGLRGGGSPKEFALNGPLVSLGMATDVKRYDDGQSDTGPIFSVSTVGETKIWKMSAHLDARSLRVETVIDLLHPALVTLKPQIQLQRLCYISAVRQGTSEVYPFPDLADKLVADVGADGRFAAFWYDQAVDDVVVSARRHPNEPATSLRKQFDAWFSTIFPEARTNVQKLQPAAQLCLQFQLSDVDAWRRPANVGFGLSYVFPILVALLVAHEDQVVVIDSPEAHLHPSAQSKMGQLLAHFAAAGVQIIVETHSDHLLNGVRLAVKDKTLAHDDVQIHFFTGPSDLFHGVVSPSLGIDGSVSDWPPGFFDQADKDLSILTGWG